MRSAIAALDHLVLATPDLHETAQWVRDATGVTPSVGGQHVGKGTRNMLCSFGPTSYLEIVGPDPDQADPEAPRPFGIDDLAAPGIVAWAMAVPNIDVAVAQAREHGTDPGPATPMQRQRPDGVLLSWRLTQPMSTTLPFIIEWVDSPHPAADSAPGLELVHMRGRHPDPAALAHALGALGIHMGVEAGAEALLVRFQGPLGAIDLP